MNYSIAFIIIYLINISHIIGKKKLKIKASVKKYALMTFIVD